MSRAPFQILVFPYIISVGSELLFGLFKRDRSTGGYWQGIAGGGEDTESIEEAALREAEEEAGIEEYRKLIHLKTKTMIPADKIGNYWGEDIRDIPEHCFGIEIDNKELSISDEHTEYAWFTYNEAMALLHWDSNKKALTELNTVLISP